MSVAPVSFFIFRHGETDWNTERRLQGHTDIPLNATGRAQAQELQKKIARLKLDCLLSSDLSRALESAQIATEGLAIPLLVSDQLREAQLGTAEGMLREEINQQFGTEYFEEWLSTGVSSLDFRFLEGESKREQLERCRNYLAMICQEHPNFKRIGVSTHGGVVSRLIHFAEKAPTERLSIGNCQLFQLDYNPKKDTWTYIKS